MTTTSRPAMQFPANSPQPPLHVRAVRNPENGALYHRDEFECWTRTGDEAVFTWISLNHHDPTGPERKGGYRWLGTVLEEVVEFTRPEVLFDDVAAHLRALEADITVMLDLEIATAPLPVLAMISSSQQIMRQVARMLGVKLDG